MNNVRKNMIFNTCGSLVYYVCQWLTTILIVRISGYEDAGILSIAMSVTAAPAIVGLFNVRSYQVSDVHGTFSEKAYIRSRTITNLLSFVVCVIMVISNGYSGQKALVIFLYMIYKISEGYADVYYGIEQKNGRLDITGTSLAIRGVGTLLLFVVGYTLSKSLVVSIIGMIVVSFTIIFVVDYSVCKKMMFDNRVGKFSEVKGVIVTCFPLAVVAFLNNLSINIPKIYLESQFGEKVMGIFSSVASPTVVIQLAATTIFAPLIPILSELYWGEKKKELIESLLQFVKLIVVLSVICLIGAKLLGRWGLVLLFTETILPYVDLFVPIVCISILIALNACMFSICTLLRVMKAQYIIGIVGVLASILFSLLFVKHFVMYGVVYALIGTLLSQILIQLFMMIYKIQRM